MDLRASLRRATDALMAQPNMRLRIGEQVLESVRRASLLR